MDNSEDFKRQAGEMMAQALRATEDRVAEVKRRAGMSLQLFHFKFILMCSYIEITDQFIENMHG